MRAVSEPVFHAALLKLAAVRARVTVSTQHWLETCASAPIGSNEQTLRWVTPLHRLLFSDYRMRPECVAAGGCGP